LSLENSGNEIKKIIDLVEKVHEKISESTVSTAVVAIDVKKNREELDKISKVLFEGNGNSILTKISLIQQRIQQMEKVDADFTKLFAMIQNNRANLEAGEIEKETTRIKSKYVFFGLIVTSLSGVIIGILGLLF